MKTNLKQNMHKAARFQRAQLRSTNEAKEEDGDKKLEEAKKDAIKTAVSIMKSPATVKLFLERNQKNIEVLQSKLEGRVAKKAFEILMKEIQSYANQSNESKEQTRIKIVTGLLAALLFMLNAPKSYVIFVGSPVIGQFLTNVISVIPWRKMTALLPGSKKKKQ